MTIGQKIKELRNNLNMSVDELAEKLGKNRATIYRYEKGDIGNLPLDVLELLATTLKTTQAYLMGWEDKNDKDEITIGGLLKKMRTQRNMTIDEYAKEIGIDPNEYLIFEGKHDPIVSKEIFDRVKEIRGKRHRTKTNSSLKNPFSGIMYCKCGAKMGYNTYRKNGVEYASPKLVCNNQVHCKSGSVEYQDVLNYVCESLRDHIRDFEVRVNNEENDSIKLHKKLVTNLERKYKELEEKELAQLDAQYDPELKMPQHIFKRLNEQVLKEKEEVKNALCEARESIPTPVDYRDKIYKFTEVVNNLEDDSVSPADKNEYLKSIIDRINYERPPIVRITKENAKMYNENTSKGMKYHMEPYTITIDLKAP